jgi:hypothetical protein
MRPLAKNALRLGAILALTLALTANAVAQNEDKGKPPAKQGGQGGMGQMT